MKTTGCIFFYMESPLPDEEMGAVGVFKKVKVRKKKESPPFQEYLTPRPPSF